MNVQYLIQVLSNKLVVLNNAKILAFNAGDFAQINAIEEEILGVENTISQLKLLTTIDNAAAITNTTPAEVVTSGIEVLQNPVQGPSAGASINGYDLSPYATDALYEQKIINILSTMPVFATTKDVDDYIQNLAAGSPVTGSMVAAAVTKYSVDIPLLIAIMQNDSLFGTMGVGARTNNPGNVGNTGVETRTYPTWQDGVTAVAEWLSRHHASVVANYLVQNTIQSTNPTVSSTPAVPNTTASSTPPIVQPTTTQPAEQLPVFVPPPTSTPNLIPSVPAPVETVPTSTPSTTPITIPTSTPITVPTSTPETATTTTPNLLERFIDNLTAPSSTPSSTVETVVPVVTDVVSSTAEVITSSPVVEVVTNTAQVATDVATTTVQSASSTTP